MILFKANDCLRSMIVRYGKENTFVDHDIRICCRGGVYDGGMVVLQL